jgi:undecaprenyl-diphosphatase
LEPWQILVALIQGLIEWLPISSEGMSILFLNNFSTIVETELLTLVVWLHLGTAFAVIAKYPKDILNIITLKDSQLLRWLLIATASTAITAIPFYLLLKESFSIFQGQMINILVGVLLLVTALILYLPTRQTIEKVTIDTTEVSDKKAAVAGLLQGFAVLPGLSRSGVTVSALLMQRVDKEKALRFSFLMSVPAVLGIFVLEIVTGTGLPSSVGVVDLALIELIVFTTGFLSMEFLLRIARRVEFWKLCIFLAAIAILFGFSAFL